jgi:hypothetical protein
MRCLTNDSTNIYGAVESLRARMSEAERQVEGLFESLLYESFAQT